MIINKGTYFSSNGFVGYIIFCLESCFVEQYNYLARVPTYIVLHVKTPLSIYIIMYYLERKFKNFVC